MLISWSFNPKYLSNKKNKDITIHNYNAIILFKKTNTNNKVPNFPNYVFTAFPSTISGYNQGSYHMSLLFSLAFSWLSCHLFCSMSPNLSVICHDLGFGESFLTKITPRWHAPWCIDHLVPILVLLLTTCLKAASNKYLHCQVIFSSL